MTNVLSLCTMGEYCNSCRDGILCGPDGCRSLLGSAQQLTWYWQLSGKVNNSHPAMVLI